MAKFCSWCGEPLEPGARYCPECGARVLESVKVDGSADAVDPMRGFDIVGGEALPADKTAKLDREQDPSGTDTLVLPTDNAQKRFTLEGSPKKTRTALIVCIALIVVLIGVVVALAVMQMNDGARDQEPLQVMQAQDEQQDAQEPSQDAAENSDEGNDEEASSGAVVQEPEREELTDDEAFAALDEAYGRLTDYNERIGDCVNDFNNLFLARSMDDRTAAKKRADGLLADLEEELSALEDLRIEASSPYADDAAAVIELYGCQLGRVQSLADAWAVDVKYDVPSQHKDEILEELSKNNEGGTNKYLTRYDELYPTAKPQKES